MLDGDGDGDDWLTHFEDANQNRNFEDDDADNDGFEFYTAGSNPLDPLSTAGSLGPPELPALGPWGLSLLGLLLSRIGAVQARRPGGRAEERSRGRSQG